MHGVGMKKAANGIRGIRQSAEGIWRKKRFDSQLGNWKKLFWFFSLKDETDFDKENRMKKKGIPSKRHGIYKSELPGLMSQVTDSVGKTEWEWILEG